MRCNGFYVHSSRTVTGVYNILPWNWTHFLYSLLFLSMVSNRFVGVGVAVVVIVVIIGGGGGVCDWVRACARVCVMADGSLTRMHLPQLKCHQPWFWVWLQNKIWSWYRLKECFETCMDKNRAFCYTTVSSFSPKTACLILYIVSSLLQT